LKALRHAYGVALYRPASECHDAVEVGGDFGGDGSAAAAFDEEHCAVVGLDELREQIAAVYVELPGHQRTLLTELFAYVLKSASDGLKRSVAPVHREGLEFEQVEEGQRKPTLGSVCRDQRLVPAWLAPVETFVTEAPPTDRLGASPNERGSLAECVPRVRARCSMRASMRLA
jgi:hypothetical protein